jgi:hypothetical protein
VTEVNAGVQHFTHSYDGHVVSFLWCRADLPFGLAQRAHSSYQFFLAAVSVYGYPFSSGPNHPVWVDRRSLIGSPFEDAAHAARRQ